MRHTKRYQRTIISLRNAILRSTDSTGSVSSVLAWLTKLRTKQTGRVTLVPIQKLSDWRLDKSAGILRHKKGTDHFFSVQGIRIRGAGKREVSSWDQPIFVQQEGGVLAILCQKQQGVIRFLLQARFEPGNIDSIQLGPTIQATQSNLKRHHLGISPRFSEYLRPSRAKLVYSAKHSEEGARFFRKSNTNMLLLLDPSVRIPLTKDDNFAWLTLPQIKSLMLLDHVINPFVKTILAPL